MIRGGLLLQKEIEEDCLKALSAIGLYGFSVFCTPGKSAEEVYAAKKSLTLRYPEVRTAEVRQIRAIGLNLLPTLKSNHYTIEIMNPLDDSVFSHLDEVFSAPVRMSR